MTLRSCLKDPQRGAIAIRELLRSAEFHAPQRLSRLALRVAPTMAAYPYSEQNDALRAIFIHVPKTGGTSITAALFKQKARHVAASRYRACDAVRFDAYLKFCFVRDPLDRLYSAYAYLRPQVGCTEHRDGRWATANLVEFPTFHDFVLGLERFSIRRRILRFTHFRPQHHWIRIPFGSACAMDYVGRFETLQEDFGTIAERLGVAVALPALRVGDHANAAGAYTGRTRAIARKVYHDDICLFGYGRSGADAR